MFRMKKWKKLRSLVNNQASSMDRPKDKRKTLKIFLNILMLQKKGVIIAIITGFIGSILYTAIPWIMGIAIDDTVTLINANPSFDIGYDLVRNVLLLPIVLIIIAAILTYLFSYIQEKIMATVSENTALILREKLSEKLTRLPLRFYDHMKVGDLLSVTSTDIDKISEILVIGFNQFMLAFFDLILGIGIMFYINVQLTIVVLIVISFSLFATIFISKKSQVSFSNNLTTLGKLNGVAEELYTGNMIIKAFNAQAKSVDIMKVENEQQYKAHKKSQFMNYVIYPAVRFINQLAFLISVVLGALLVIRGNITLGVVQAYLQYVSQVSEPMTQFSFVINSFQASLASIERIYQILDEPEESLDDEKSLRLKQPKGNLEFKDVVFGYEKDTPLFKGVNFKAHQNQTIAIVGPTGAGKTTLVNLLMRFYEIDSGAILFDGEDTAQMSRGYVRSLFGMVLQDTWLFKGTVADNIAYGKKDATREEIIEAAKLAQCDYFIRTLENGYDTIISSDQEILSQGQQQLLTIARAALSNPSVMILDEATSSIDTITEVKIQKAIELLMENRTSFIIAHRLSTIKNADLILVMKDGNIIETGSHEQLLARDSFYAKLYNS